MHCTLSRETATKTNQHQIETLVFNAEALPRRHENSFMWCQWYWCCDQGFSRLGDIHSSFNSSHSFRQLWIGMSRIIKILHPQPQQRLYMTTCSIGNYWFRIGPCHSYMSLLNRNFDVLQLSAFCYFVELRFRGICVALGDTGLF